MFNVTGKAPMPRWLSISLNIWVWGWIAYALYLLGTVFWP